MAATAGPPLDLYRATTGSPAPLARNPVALRLYKVLGATFEDTHSAQALTELAALYPAPADATPAPAHAPSSTLDFLSGPPPGDTAARARRTLRRDTEAKLGAGAGAFLAAFGAVDAKLDVLAAHLADMRARCADAEAKLGATNAACRALLERAEALRGERAQVDARGALAAAFLARFTMSEDEAAALTAADVPVGKRFFAAMDKAAAIRADAGVLMHGGPDGGPSRAGVDVMAATARGLEGAHEKLFKWCSAEFRALGRDAALDVAPNLREAVSRLRARPELLEECLTTLAQTRRAALQSAFLAALTHPPSGRPIELHAHDALRYVGDMLAWVHQALAAEHEFLEALLGAPRTARMVGAVRAAGAGDAWVPRLMDAALGGLCGALRARVLDAVRGCENAVVGYKVASVLGFYALTMLRTLGADAALSVTLRETTDAAYKVFFDAIEAQGRALLRAELEPGDASLAPPPALLAHFSTLRTILSLHAADADAAGAGELARVLDTLVDPALHMLYGAAEEKEERERRRGRGWDAKVFVLNGLTYIAGVLEPYAFTKAKREVVEKLVDERVAELIEEHYENLLQDTGLKDAVHALDTKQPSDILSRLPATAPPALTRALHTFALWLADPDTTHSARLAQLSAPALHARAHRAALRRLGRAYARLCGAVREPGGRYEAAATLLGSERPFGSLGALWQIFGIDEEGDDEDEGGAE